MRRLWQHLTMRRELASTLAALGPTRWDRLYLLLVPFVMSLWQRLPWLQDRWLHLRLEDFGQTFTCAISDSSELFVLADVFCDEQYRLPDNVCPRTILDLGSHIGASIIFFSLKYPQASIYGFEPHPETFRKLQRNVGDLANVRIFRAAVADTDGPVTLFEGRGSWASSLRADWGSEDSGRIVVEGKTIDTILHDLRLASVDLMKIDVEGVELDILRATQSPEARAAVIVGEVHDFLPRWEKEAADLEELLISRGFRWESRRYRTDHVFLAIRHLNPVGSIER
jgi:FkbM family methyltransferase